MKKGLIAAAIVLLLALLACFFILRSGKPGAYLAVIPDNPVALLKFNAGNILEESEILRNPVLKPLLATSSEGTSGAADDLLKKIIENPEESGLDLKEPVVLALLDTDTLKALITVAVTDKEKLENAVMYISGGSLDIVDNGEVCFIETGENGISVAYDNEKLLFAISDTNADVLEYFGYDGKKAVDNEKLIPFFCSEDDVALYICGSRVHEFLVNADYFRYNTRHLDDIEVLKNANAIVSLNFEKGFAELALDLDVPQDFVDMYAKYIRPSSKEHLEYVPADAFLAVDMGLDFALTDESSEGESAENGTSFSRFDISLLKNICGDVTFAMLQPQQYGRNKMPQMMAVIDCTGPEAFNSVVNLAGMFMTVESVEEDVYDLNIIKRGYDYYMAYKEQRLFVLPENIYRALNETGMLKPFEDNLLGNKNVSAMGNGAYVGVDEFYKAFAHDRGIKQYGPVLSALEYVRFEMESPARLTLRVAAKDKETNFLKQAVDKAIELYLTISLK